MPVNSGSIHQIHSLEGDPTADHIILLIKSIVEKYLQVYKKYLECAANTESRQRLRSSSSQQLIAPRTRLLTVGDRAFGAAAAHIWNSLPLTVTTAETLNSFKKHLKTHLVHCSFPSCDITYRRLSFCYRVLAAFSSQHVKYCRFNNNNNKVRYF